MKYYVFQLVNSLFIATSYNYFAFRFQILQELSLNLKFNVGCPMSNYNIIKKMSKWEF